MGFFITVTINDASVGIVDDEGNFQFSPKATFTSTFYIHITLAADTKRRILRNCDSVKNIMKSFAFKWLLKGHVNLVICLN